MSNFSANRMDQQEIDKRKDHLILSFVVELIALGYLVDKISSSNNSGLLPIAIYLVASLFYCTMLARFSYSLGSSGLVSGVLTFFTKPVGLFVSFAIAMIVSRKRNADGENIDRVEGRWNKPNR